MFKNKFLAYTSSVFLFAFVFFVQNVFAQSSPATLNNPLKDIDTVQEFVAKAVEIIFTIAIPVLAVFFIYSGYKFVEAQGNSSKIETAQKIFLNTCIGAAVLLGAWVIAEAIQGTVKQIITE